MKDNVTYIEYKGKKYDIVFDINVIETLQIKYGSFNKWTELVQPTDGTECKLTAEKSDKLKSSVKAFFKADKEFTPVKFFENALDGANVYVLKVGEQFVGVYEVGDEMTVDCVLN